MNSLAELFNPQFFIILGIVVLLIGLVTVYFETKMREQNHKISSMLSLVSTLAEDVTGVKFGLNHLAITLSNGGSEPEISQNIPFQPPNLGKKSSHENKLNLIEVSDDEPEEDDEEEEETKDGAEEIEDEEEDEETEDEDEETEDEDEDGFDVKENIKIVKLNISEDDVLSYDAVNNYDPEYDEDEEYNLNSESDGDLVVLDDADEIPKISEGHIEQILSLKYDDKVEDDKVEDDKEKETLVTTYSDIKTISVNLGEEPISGDIDYQKLNLSKLRKISVEKGLTTNSQSQKLKKQELLKMFGVK